MLLYGKRNIVNWPSQAFVPKKMLLFFKRYFSRKKKRILKKPRNLVKSLSY